MAKRPGALVGLDVGDVRIGVAVSDPLGILASPREVLRRTSDEADVAAVARIVEETEAAGVVIGLPLTNRGDVGHQAQKVRAFEEQLKQALSVPIYEQDERFTSAESQRQLANVRAKRKKRKQVVDKLAAHHILTAFLEERGRDREE